jgi:hypothetical protein
MWIYVYEESLPRLEAFVIQFTAVQQLVVAHDLLEHLSSSLFVKQVLPLASTTVIVLLGEEQVEEFGL